jgi:hypothetical protein
MGFETFIRFQLDPDDPRIYAPEAFLSSLAATGGLALNVSTPSSGTTFEYRPHGPHGVGATWPAVTITVVADGFLVCEYDRDVGTRLLGPLVKFALDHAKDERVIVESA